MPIRVVCPQCGKALNAPDTAAGKVASCPDCKGKVAIPGAGGAVAPIVAQAARQAVPVATPTTPVPPPIAVVTPPIAVAKAVVLPAIPVGGPPMLPTTASSNPMAGFSLDEFGGSAEGGVVLGSAPLVASPLLAAAGGRRNVGSLMPLFIIAAAVLGAGILMGGVYWLTRGGGGGDWMKWMPDSSQMIARVKMAAIMRYFDDLKNTNAQFRQQFDKVMSNSRISPADVDSFSAASIDLRGNPPPILLVIQLNRNVSEQDLTEGKQIRREQHGEFTIYHIADNQGACKVDDYTMVGGDLGLLKSVLTREGRPQLSPGLQHAIEKADFSADVAVAANLQGLSSAGAMPVPGGFDPSKLEGLAIAADLGSSIRLEGTLLCNSSDTASQLKTQADQMMQAFGPMLAGAAGQMPGVQDAWDSISIDRSGSNLTFSVTIPESLIEQAKQQASGFRPPGMGGGFGGGS